mgnify:CR=1 FL=1|jgi:hypothetical protein
MEKLLSESEMHGMRQTGVLSKDEIALKIGDLVVAENVLTRERRVLDVPRVGTTEGRKRVLKG